MAGLTKAKALHLKYLDSLLEGIGGHEPVRQRTPNWTHSAAVLSEDGVYRYRLERTMGKVEGYPALTFIMLNPSTADSSEDDPTIRRCWGFTMREKFLRMVVVNLFALISTDPKALPLHADPVGPENRVHLKRAIEEAVKAKTPIVASWGAKIPQGYQGQEDFVLHTLKNYGEGLGKVLRHTAGGHPAHPLYLPGNARLQPLFTGSLI